MTFDKIIDDGRLWAVRYDKDKDNALQKINRLSRYQSDSPSAWRGEEAKRMSAKKQGWLQYSRKIAIKVALAMQCQNISRQDLAERIKRPVSYSFKTVERRG